VAGARLTPPRDTSDTKIPARQHRTDKPFRQLARLTVNATAELESTMSRFSLASIAIRAILLAAPILFAASA
jgi:hypothetical protein